MSETNTQPVIEPPPAEVMRSGDSAVWAAAFVARMKPVKLDQSTVELWMRSAISTGFIMGQRTR